MRNRRGIPVGNLRNALYALRNAPDWQGVLRYDEFASQVLTLRPPPWEGAAAEEAWGDEHDCRCSARPAIWLGVRLREHPDTRGVGHNLRKRVGDLSVRRRCARSSSQHSRNLLDRAERSSPKAATPRSPCRPMVSIRAVGPSDQYWAPGRTAVALDFAHYNLVRLHKTLRVMPATLLSNFDYLGLDPRNINALVVSHGHFDHYGGLIAFLDKYRDGLPSDIKLYAGGEDNFCHRVWPTDRRRAPSAISATWTGTRSRRAKCRSYCAKARRLLVATPLRPVRSSAVPTKKFYPIHWSNKASRTASAATLVTMHPSSCWEKPSRTSTITSTPRYLT